MSKEPLVLKPSKFISAGERVRHPGGIAILQDAKVEDGRLYLLLNVGAAEPIQVWHGHVEKMSNFTNAVLPSLQ